MKASVTNKSNSRFLTAQRFTLPRGLQLFAGALGVLMSCAVSAQGQSELTRLIFDVAPIPVDASDAASAGNGGNGAGAGDGTAGVTAGEPNVGTAVAPAAGAQGTIGAVAPAAAPASELTAAPVNSTADISAYRARIADIVANDNPYSSTLREQYDALGTALQQTGAHEEAITAFESAMQIDRVNGGLYTLDQIPLVEKIIASHDALGHGEEVNDFHAYLFYIQQRSYDEGDPRLLAAKEEWADWNVESWLRARAEHPSSIEFSAGGGIDSGDYVAVQDPRSGSFVYVPRMQMLAAMNGLFDPAFLQSYGVDAERVIDERLRTARTYYEDITEAAAPAEAGDLAAPDSAVPATADTHRVQRKLANVAHAIRDQLADIDTVSDTRSLFYNRSAANYSPPPTVTRGYTRNRDTLEAIAQQLEQDAAVAPAAKAQAWIDVGDWNVSFDNAQRGNEAYRKAWDLLRAAGMDEAAISAVFMPQLLVPAPTFVIHRYTREAHGLAADVELTYKGHMDLTLDVSRFGDVSRIKIDSAIPEASQVLRSELLDYLREQKVRPAVVDGETVKREDVKLRYYYSY